MLVKSIESLAPFFSLKKRKTEGEMCANKDVNAMTCENNDDV